MSTELETLEPIYVPNAMHPQVVRTQLAYIRAAIYRNEAEQAALLQMMAGLEGLLRIAPAEGAGDDLR